MSLGDLASAIARCDANGNDVHQIERRGLHHTDIRAGLEKLNGWVITPVEVITTPEFHRSAALALSQRKGRYSICLKDYIAYAKVESVYAQIMNPALRTNYFLKRMGDRLRRPQATKRAKHFLKMANDPMNFEFVARFLTGR